MERAPKLARVGQTVEEERERAWVKDCRSLPSNEGQEGGYCSEVDVELKSLALWSDEAPRNHDRSLQNPDANDDIRNMIPHMRFELKALHDTDKFAETQRSKQGDMRSNVRLLATTLLAALL